MKNSILKTFKKNPNLILLSVISLVLGLYILNILGLLPKPVSNMIDTVLPDFLKSTAPQQNLENFQVVPDSRSTGNFQDAYSKTFDIIIGNSNTRDARWYKIMEIDNQIIEQSVGRAQFSLQLDVYPSPGSVSHQKFLLSVKNSVDLNSARYANIVKSKMDPELSATPTDEEPVMISRSDIITGFNDQYYTEAKENITSNNILDFVEVDFDELILYGREDGGKKIFEVWIRTAKEDVINVPVTLTLKHNSIGNLSEDDREFRVNVNGDNIAFREQLSPPDSDGNRTITLFEEIDQSAEGIASYTGNIGILKAKIACHVHNNNSCLRS